jgi:hypothetical protein
VAFDSLSTNTTFVDRVAPTRTPVPVVNNAFDRLMAAARGGGGGAAGGGGGKGENQPPKEGEEAPGYYRTADNELRFRFANGATVPATGVDRI